MGGAPRIPALFYRSVALDLVVQVIEGVRLCPGQPKVALDTCRTGCAEALVRWVDQYIFEEVCRWLRTRLDTGQRVLPVWGNVSRLLDGNR